LRGRSDGQSGGQRAATGVVNYEAPAGVAIEARHWSGKLVPSGATVGCYGWVVT